MARDPESPFKHLACKPFDLCRRSQTSAVGFRPLRVMEEDQDTSDWSMHVARTLTHLPPEVPPNSLTATVESDKTRADLDRLPEIGRILSRVPTTSDVQPS